LLGCAAFTERGAKQMRSFVGRYVLGSYVAAAMLAGCGGSQPPIGATGAMPQTSAVATHADRGKSWMLPEATSQDLLYVTNYYYTSVYSYPTLKLVGVLKDFKSTVGDCVERCFQSPNARARLRRTTKQSLAACPSAHSRAKRP
jgi:hypothetical protein